MTQRTPSLSDATSTVDVVSLPATAESTRQEDPHELECRIQRRLQSHPGLRFTRLTVHQCPQGVCLEGLLELNEDGLDLCELVNEIAGVRALNHVVMRRAVPK
jgi:hypothetical protein